MINTGILSAKKNFTCSHVLPSLTSNTPPTGSVRHPWGKRGVSSPEIWMTMRENMYGVYEAVSHFAPFCSFFFFCCTYRKSSRLIERQVLTAIKEFKDNTRSSNEQNTSQDAVNMVCTPTRLYARTYVN